MREAANVPVSTYRLQFHGGFTFLDAAALAEYLARLGVTHCYSSPYLMARPGSTHGYDICDHTRLNPEIGSADDYQAFVHALHARGLGQILDFVPNHMGNDPKTNPWWHDVLENGPSSAFAHYFDIDWTPVKRELRGKVLLPILGDQYGLVLERGELRLGYRDGALCLEYFDNELPINPRSAAVVFGQRLDDLRGTVEEEDPDWRELLSIITALGNLPASVEQSPGRISERRREKEVARERMARLTDRSARVRAHVERALVDFNGTVGQPRTFDLLHGLLELQSYRLAYWRTASHEINYRRFFDVNALAGLRMEDEDVFDATHRLVAGLLAEGAVSGLRIDHPDGLYDPVEYFERLQALWHRVAPSRADGHPEDRPLYVVAEKILSPGEELPEAWQVAGTTGYQFVAQVAGIFIDPAGERPLRQLYGRFAKLPLPFAEVMYQGKQLIATSSLASELNVLAQALNRISEGNRRSRDFTLETLRTLLAEVVACFPVYRTYVSGRGWAQDDRDRIEAAVTRARWRNPTVESSIFDFLREVLLPRRDTDEPAGTRRDRRDGYAPGDLDDHQARLAFSMKLQQYTAPVQAKGVEDTAFYRYNPLVSLNEVGGDPSRFGRPVAEFHAANAERLDRWPLEMLATSTHDTKLGEDARTRIAVLSEIPAEWRKHVSRWARVNAVHRTTLQGAAAPDRNDEYRFYQILLGAWPDDVTSASAELVARFRDYMLKAIKEAKVHTSWIIDNEDYDRSMAAFVERVLSGRGADRFLPLFLPFRRRVAELALASSLGQLVLKIAAPGVPDTYQGCELWDLHLVDPDNRRPVDFATRDAMLRRLDASIDQAAAGSHEGCPVADAVHDLLATWEDGRIKLWVTAASLRLRRALPDLFRRGRYVALEARGAAAPHVVAFARHHGHQAAIAIAPRLVASLGANWREWNEAWSGWNVSLPEELAGRNWMNVLTGRRVEGHAGTSQPALALGPALAGCPVALLVSR
jgi:(1->4)-alpha-D-glucan 1-alpha-D-glucosylmutase